VTKGLLLIPNQKNVRAGPMLLISVVPRSSKMNVPSVMAR
jgi:hypothetical protein